MKHFVVPALLCAIGIALPANAANPDHVRQLLDTNECRQCDLQDADLQGTNLQNAQLQGADLSGADLSQANLQSADLRNANLWSINLREANLQGANLSQAILENATLQNATLTDAIAIALRGYDTNFYGVNATNTNFEFAALSNTNLGNANLSGAKLRKANLVSANLDNANLQTANLTDAIFYRANLTEAQLPSWLWQDTTEHRWQSCLWELGKQQVLSGYPDGTFRPDNPVSRVEFAAMIRNAFPNAPTVRYATQFRDIAASYWGADAIRTANRTGFLSGYPGRIFRPNLNIPRVQVLVALASGLDLPLPSNASQMLDRALARNSVAVPDYAIPKTAAALKEHLVIRPLDAEFDPNQYATRAEVAASICQARQPSGHVERVPLQYIIQSPPEPPSAPATAWENVQLTHRIETESTSVKLSNNGQTLVTHNRENAIQFWDTDSGEFKQTISVGENSKIVEIAVSPNGETVASLALSSDETSLSLQLWNAQTGDEARSLSPLEVPEPEIFATGELTAKLAYSPDGQFLATSVSSSQISSKPYSVQVWALETGAIAQTLETSRHAVQTLEFAPNSKLLASVTDDDKIHLWDVETGQEKFVFEDKLTILSHLDFNADSTQLVALVSDINGVEPGVRLWDVQTGELRHTFDNSFDRTLQVKAISFDSQVALGTSNVVGVEIVDLWRDRIYNLKGLSAGSPNRIQDVVFSSDGKSLAISAPEAVYVWR